MDNKKQVQTKVSNFLEFDGMQISVKESGIKFWIDIVMKKLENYKSIIILKNLKLIMWLMEFMKKNIM